MTLPGLSQRDLQVQPLSRAETIPSSWYTDPAFHAVDRRLLIAPSWQYVGSACQISRPGEYLSDSIAGEPVLVVRDTDGGLRGWFNVCRHRGGPLVTEPCGQARMLQCQYHGWTYRLDGSLRGVPRFDRSELFDKRDFGLVPVQVAEWEGLVFVALDPAPPLGETFSGIPERIHPLNLSGLEHARRVEYRVACNWKVYVDNYLEGYHLPMVHPELCDLLDVRKYVTETYPTYSLQYSPLQDEDNIYSAGGGDAFYYFVFPNLMLNILPGRLQINRVDALGPGQTRVLFDYYYPAGTSAATIEEDLSFSDRVQLEDVEICEHVQKGLASRAYDRGRFSPEAEPGVYHFQCMLKDAFRKHLDSESPAGSPPAGT